MSHNYLTAGPRVTQSHPVTLWSDFYLPWEEQRNQDLGWDVVLGSQLMLRFQRISHEITLPFGLQFTEYLYSNCFLFCNFISRRWRRVEGCLSRLSELLVAVTCALCLVSLLSISYHWQSATVPLPVPHRHLAQAVQCRNVYCALHSSSDNNRHFIMVLINGFKTIYIYFIIYYFSVIEDSKLCAIKWCFQIDAN